VRPTRHDVFSRDGGQPSRLAAVARNDKDVGIALRAAVFIR